MPVTRVEKDLNTLTLTIVADSAAPPSRLWDAYTDPRQLERFWGPPTYPANFLRHDVAPGGRSIYRMTGPTGDDHYGCWDWTAVSPPGSFEVVEAQILSETQVRVARVARVIRGSVDQVWRAHNDADLMKQWLLGPDGWTMPVCEIATNTGDPYRYVWEPEGGGEGFGFTGELLENEPPYRAVTTEAMIGMDFPATRNELTLTSVDGGTLLSLVITYADAALRDAVLATGMTDGMETSYQRLENLLEDRRVG